VLQCVAVCCSVLQCDAVRCMCHSKLQCVAVCCSMLQWVAVCYSVLLQYVAMSYVRCVLLQSNAGCIAIHMLQCVTVCYSVLQCVTVCCSVLQCVAVCCSVLQCIAVYSNLLQCVAVCCIVSKYTPHPAALPSHPSPLSSSYLHFSFSLATFSRRGPNPFFFAIDN